MQPTVIQPDTSAEFLTPERCHILEILNVAAQPAFSLARARVEPGVTTALHALDGTDETYYVLSGEGAMELAGRPAGTVRPGDAVFIPKGVPQRITNTGPEDLVFLCICTPRFEEGCYRDLEQ